MAREAAVSRASNSEKTHEHSLTAGAARVLYRVLLYYCAQLRVAQRRLTRTDVVVQDTQRCCE